jgi:hypothetical protein
MHSLMNYATSMTANATHQGSRKTSEDGYRATTQRGIRIASARDARTDRETGAVFESLEERVRGKHCEGIAGIIDEGKAIMEEDFDDATMDACLIAAGQRAEHYEIAAYGTLIAWARAMGHDEAADLLQQNLDEEKVADEKLSSLAESGINQGAADGAHAEGDEEDTDTVGASRGTNASIGILSILHTWGQTLVRHPHVHCVAPTGGLSPDHRRWIRPKYAGFFLPSTVLSRVFRGKFVAALRRAYARGDLELAGATEGLRDPEHWHAFVDALFATDWIVYRNRPSWRLRGAAVPRALHTPRRH